MFFAAFTAKTAVFSRRMKLDGGVALLHLCICNTPFCDSRSFVLKCFLFFKKSQTFLAKPIDKIAFFGYNRYVPFQTEDAGVAQSVVQLIRNQQVVCSSHITSSNLSLSK